MALLVHADVEALLAVELLVSAVGRVEVIGGLGRYAEFERVAGPVYITFLDIIFVVVCWAYAFTTISHCSTNCFSQPLDTAGDDV